MVQVKLVVEATVEKDFLNKEKNIEVFRQIREKKFEQDILAQNPDIKSCSAEIFIDEQKV